jgi:hypothetical protein
MHKDLEQHRSGECGEGEAVSAVRVLPPQLLLRQFKRFFVDSALFYFLRSVFRPLVGVIVLFLG